MLQLGWVLKFRICLSGLGCWAVYLVPIPPCSQLQLLSLPLSSPKEVLVPPRGRQPAKGVKVEQGRHLC